MEIYKDIIGYENHYQISNYGNVKSLKSDIVMRNQNSCGYKIIKLCLDGSVKYPKVHRLVAQAFIPNPLGKEQVNHIDGNKTNNHVSNLEWSTPKENIDHAESTGLRNSKGIDNPKAKITEKQVIEIRNKFQPRVYTYDMLASEYGLTKSTVARIVKRIYWKHI